MSLYELVATMEYAYIQSFFSTVVYFMVLSFSGWPWTLYVANGHETLILLQILQQCQGFLPYSVIDSKDQMQSQYMLGRHSASLAKSEGNDIFHPVCCRISSIWKP